MANVQNMEVTGKDKKNKNKNKNKIRLNSDTMYMCGARKISDITSEMIRF